MDAIYMQNTSINTFIHHGYHLSNDLLIEILLQLPFKSLARFKCVSKPWKMLISDPHFQKRLPTIMMGLLYQQWKISLGEVGYMSVSNQSCRIQSLMDLNLNFCPVYPNLRFMGCTNGLLLLLHGSARPPCPHIYHGNLPPHPDVFYVCNPATRRWAALPEYPRAKNWYDCVLIFDPCRSPHFKVIRIGSLTSTTLELTIFYSKTGLWVKSTTTTALHHHYLTSRGIISPDGIIYRLTFTQMLLRINIEDESCVEIKLPRKATPFPNFGICHGNLHCAQLLEGFQLLVWEVKNELGNEWDLKHSNCIEAVVRQNFERSEFGTVILLAFHLDMEVIYLGLSNKIISYNFISEIVEEIYSFSQQHHVSRNLRAHPFKPSFLDCLDDAHHNW